MDATGLSPFSALPLFPLMLLFWYLDGLSRTEVGFVWGRLRHYGPPILHSCVVLGLLALSAWFAGAVNLEKFKLRSAGINFALVAGSTFLVAMVTEEGFFRGWLWGSLKRAGWNENWVLAWSSLAFVLWHFSAVLLDTGFNPPLRQVPVFLVNAAVLGAIWGLMRRASGSIVVSSLAHGIWNGGAYVFFGFGTKVGTLGIESTWLYGPEVGVLGLVLNLAFAAVLWRFDMRRRVRGIRTGEN
jgi:membrane protease YdiL (CAAX protease family)